MDTWVGKRVLFECFNFHQTIFNIIARVKKLTYTKVIASTLDWIKISTFNLGLRGTVNNKSFNIQKYIQK